jgi:hypothetical protein
MKAQRDQGGWTILSLHFWTYPEAVKAIPYLRAVVGSLRDHWLQLRETKLRQDRLQGEPGRPSRETLLLREELLGDAERAGHHCDEDLNDLMVLDVYSLDPSAGIALIPFAHQGQLAWFVFDLFASQAIESWQLLGDAPEARRSLVSVAPASPGSPVFRL